MSAPRFTSGELLLASDLNKMSDLIDAAGSATTGKYGWSLYGTPTAFQPIVILPFSSSGFIPVGLASWLVITDTAVTGVVTIDYWNSSAWTQIGVATFTASTIGILSSTPSAQISVTKGAMLLRWRATTVTSWPGTVTLSAYAETV
jgi:hypothetical protein